MAEKIISDLESLPSINGDEVLPVENGSGTFSTSINDVKNYAVNDAISSNQLSNLGLETSVGSNALTIAVKTKAGANATSASPVKIGFRNSTVTNGGYNVRTIAAALSLVISSGSTLGTIDGKSEELFVYAIDNAGTIELAVSMTYFEDGSIQSTTAEGGAGGADSNRVLYSASARSNVPIRLIGKITITESTAGTWASNATKLEVPPFRIQPIHALYTSSAGQSIANAATPIIDFGTKVIDTHNAVTTGSSWVFTAPRAGKYQVCANVRYANSQAWGQGKAVASQITKNGSAYILSDISIGATATLTTGPTTNIAGVVDCAAGDTISIKTGHEESASRSLVAAGSLVWVTITEIK